MSEMMRTLGIDELTVEQRILLVEEIWDSIGDGEKHPPISEAQKRDLDRRLAAYEANPKAGSSWEEVKARLRANQ